MWMRNYKLFSIARGMSRKGLEMTDRGQAMKAFYSPPARQLKFHPKGEGEPPKGFRQERAMVRFMLDTC